MGWRMLASKCGSLFGFKELECVRVFFSILHALNVLTESTGVAYFKTLSHC